MSSVGLGSLFPYSPQLEPFTEELRSKNLKIIRKILSRSEEVPHIQKICADEEFIKHPTYYILRLMVQRGAGGKCESDAARVRIIGYIPNFIEQATNLEYLYIFGIGLYKSHSKMAQITKILDHFISVQYVHQITYLFDIAKFWYYEEKYERADEYLRAGFRVFSHAEKLQTEISWESENESASKKMLPLDKV